MKTSMQWPSSPLLTSQPEPVPLAELGTASE
jgi:hypothetical protein